MSENDDLKLFRVPFKKIVYGYAEVYAVNKDDHDTLLNQNNWIDEEDNKSFYEYEKENIEEIKR